MNLNQHLKQKNGAIQVLWSFMMIKMMKEKKNPNKQKQQTRQENGYVISPLSLTVLL